LRFAIFALGLLVLAACDVRVREARSPEAPTPGPDAADGGPEPPWRRHPALSRLSPPPAGFQQLADEQIASRFSGARLPGRGARGYGQGLEEFYPDGRYSVGEPDPRRGRWWAQDGRLCHSTGSDVVCRRVLASQGRTYFASVEVTNLDPAIPPRATSFPPVPSGLPEQSGSPRVVRNPNWIAKPTASQMERAYPPRALEEGLRGRTVIQCSITRQGALTTCAVISESPAGHGFGAAAMRLSRYFKMAPRTVDGLDVEGALVNVPITFATG
jgi:TonB family protein